MTRNYKNFYRLLKILSDTCGISGEDLKNDLISSVTLNRTTHLGAMDDMEYSLMIGAMEAEIKDGKNKTGDLWRKRVMGSIGGWIRIANVEVEGNEAVFIKKLACRAAGDGIKDFNKIPVNKLRAIYYEFLNKQKIAKNVSKIN
ncbi:MAG: hypothetical protein LBE04_05715 [Prevotellaceae bacterium]|nr:hypothetical protein [Prevotellaceae bacterium]